MFLRFMKLMRNDMPITTKLEDIDIKDIDLDFLREIETADVFDFLSKENLDRIYKAASAKGIKIFGMTKAIKEDDSVDIIDMKKSLAAISNTAKEALDGIGTETKAEEIAPAGEKPSSSAPTTEANTVNVVDKLSSLLPNKEEATAAEPAEEPSHVEEDFLEGMDL